MRSPLPVVALPQKVTWVLTMQGRGGREGLASDCGESAPWRRVLRLTLSIRRWFNVQEVMIGDAR